MLGLMSQMQRPKVACAAHSRSPAPQIAARSSRPSTTPSSEQLYDSALQAARRLRIKSARGIFESLLQREPRMCKAWVSYAMMEKRAATGQERWERCRQVLQRGLTVNPGSACLTQAFGLMELQRGNLLGAIMLLERSVRMDPCLEPVLKWTQVEKARKTVGSRRQARRGTSTNDGGMSSMS